MRQETRTNDVVNYFRDGAYAFQQENDSYLRNREGSLTNVIGLPMESLTRHLEWLG